MVWFNTKGFYFLPKFIFFGKYSHRIAGFGNRKYSCSLKCYNLAGDSQRLGYLKTYFYYERYGQLKSKFNCSKDQSNYVWVNQIFD